MENTINENFVAKYLTVVCREVDKITGKISVYEIKEPVTDEMLTRLASQSRHDLALSYYAVLANRWNLNGSWRKDAEKVLYRRNCTVEKINRLGGITKL